MSIAHKIALVAFALLTQCLYAESDGFEFEALKKRPVGCNLQPEDPCVRQKPGCTEAAALFREAEARYHEWLYNYTVVQKCGEPSRKPESSFQCLILGNEMRELKRQRDLALDAVRECGVKT